LKISTVTTRTFSVFLLILCLFGYTMVFCYADLAYLMTVEEMTEKADVILVGMVESIFHCPADPNDVLKMHRQVSVSVEWYLKNALNSTRVTVLVLGATLGNFTMWVEDQPEFNVSERVLLFLRDDPWFLEENPNSYYQVLGECQGKFIVEEELAISKSGLVVRDGDELHGVKFALGATPPPLPPILSDLAISPFIAQSGIPARIELGDNVTIRFVVTNTDNRSFVYTATMQIGDVTLMIDVELEAYEAKTVSHTITPNTVGFYDVKVDGLTGCFYVWSPEEKPAEFEVSELKIFTGIEEGADVTIYVNVSNLSEVEGTHQVDLILEGGDILFYTVYSKNVTLPGGASEEVPLCIEGGLTAGSYQVEVEGLTGSFTVKPESSSWDNIPGFPYESILLGLIFGLLAIWFLYRPHDSMAVRMYHTMAQGYKRRVGEKD
jgi:hypothetical protein